jgi:hypothetical protein
MEVVRVCAQHSGPGALVALEVLDSAINIKIKEIAHIHVLVPRNKHSHPFVQEMHV